MSAHRGYIGRWRPVCATSGHTLKDSRHFVPKCPTMDVAQMDVGGASVIGVSCTMELRNIANLQDLRSVEFVEKVLRVLNVYNNFGMTHTVNFASCEGSEARVFAQMSAGARVMFQTFPESRYATLVVFSKERRGGVEATSGASVPDGRKMFFDIYDYMVQAFSAEYHSECISFVEHRE